MLMKLIGLATSLLLISGSALAQESVLISNARLVVGDGSVPAPSLFQNHSVPKIGEILRLRFAARRMTGFDSELATGSRGRQAQGRFEVVEQLA